MTTTTISPVAHPGIGGSPSFPARAQFPFVVDRSMDFHQQVLLENASATSAEMVIRTDLPSGFGVRFATGDVVVLPPRSSRHYDFDITSNGLGKIGVTSGLISFDEINVRAAKDGGIALAPAIEVPVSTVLEGASGRVTIEAINRDNGAAAHGTIMIDYVGSNGIRARVGEGNGSQLPIDLAPGHYEATFSVPGVTTKTVSFMVHARQVQVIRLYVNGIQYFLAGVNPIGSLHHPSAARLVSVVINNLGRYVGAVSFSVNVRHDGVVVDRYRFAHLTQLPSGSTQEESTYLPPGGFSPGTWSFSFLLNTAHAQVPYPHMITFVIPSGFAWRNLLFLTLVLLAVLIVLRVVLRRRRLPESQRRGRHLRR